MSKGDVVNKLYRGITNLCYQLIANLGGPVVVLAATAKGRFGGRWRERLGLKFYPCPAWESPRVWVHGASVGEIKSAAVLVQSILELKPNYQVYLSSGTPTGLKVAQDIFEQEPQVTVMAPPLDFWGSPTRTLVRLKPQLLIIMETELWPNLIKKTGQLGIPLMLAAGRLTQRSFKRYGLVKSFMASLLENFTLLATSGVEARDFLAALGAPPERLIVMGNPKFDQLITQDNSPTQAEKTHRWREKLWGDSLDGQKGDDVNEISPKYPLIVVGSTHLGEDELVLSAFKELQGKHPNLKLILAPRHLNRAQALLDKVKVLGYSACLVSRDERAALPLLLSPDNVFILNSLGDLPSLYSLATISVVGGSLLPELTGHNPLEAAAVGSPIIFGPYMSSFKDEAQGLLGADGAVETSIKLLANHLGHWLDHPEEAQAAGLMARDWLSKRPLVAPALAQAAIDIIQGCSALPSPKE